MDELKTLGTPLKQQIQIKTLYHSTNLNLIHVFYSFIREKIPWLENQDTVHMKS